MVVSLKHFNYNKQNTFVLAGNNRLPTCPPSPSKKKENVNIKHLKPGNKTFPLFLQSPWEGLSPGHGSQALVWDFRVDAARLDQTLPETWGCSQ